MMIYVAHVMTQIGSSCEHCNKPTVSIKHREFLDRSRNHYFLQEGLAPCIIERTGHIKVSKLPRICGRRKQ